MNFALINPRVWLEIALAALIAGACWWAYNAVYDRGADHVQRKWDAEEKERSDQSAKVASDALAVTKSLQATFDTQRSQTNAQIAALNSSLAGAINGLSNRPARAADGSVPRNPSTGSTIGATGADLLRQDSEFLIRESSRADKLRLQLIDCQRSYEAARAAIK